jgi:hypothetical protein
MGARGKIGRADLSFEPETFEATLVSRLPGWSLKVSSWADLKREKYRDRPDDLRRIEAEVAREAEEITVAPHTREIPE